MIMPLVALCFTPMLDEAQSFAALIQATCPGSAIAMLFSAWCHGNGKVRVFELKKSIFDEFLESKSIEIRLIAIYPLYVLDFHLTVLLNRNRQFKEENST